MAVTWQERPIISERDQAPRAAVARQPVEWWALLGLAFTVFWAYVLIRWVAGPYFKTVPGGPEPLPTWMHIVFVAWQAAAIPFILVALYLGVVRPWRRQRTVPLNGLLLIGFLSMSLQDAVPDMFGWWYTTNSHLVNIGSFYNEIPGWSAFTRPGVIVPWVPLFNLIEYPFGLFVPVWGGAWLMNRTRARWGLGPGALVALLFPAMMVWDFIAEGLIFSLLGFYTFPGGHLSLFPDSYHKFTLLEAVFVAAFLTPLVAICYFRNEDGETLVERGVGKLKVSDSRRLLLRLLAVIAMCQVLFFAFYNLPMAGYGANPGRWPAAIQSRSYFTDRLCGVGTNRLCPGPGVPLTRNAWLNARGQLQGPVGRELTMVPNDARGPVPFTGPLFGMHSK